jgi:tetratricopeptide (TPR) repeat protein
MKSPATPCISEKSIAGILVFVLIAGIVPAVPLRGQSDSPAALGKTKSIAETQHEIAILLIRQKEFQKALTEANKIFEMKWPDDQEPVLLKALLYISGEFVRQGQAAFGLQVIDGNSKFFKRLPSQVSLWKEKGYLYKSMNQNEKAIDCFRKAQELEDRK